MFDSALPPPALCLPITHKWSSEGKKACQRGREGAREGPRVGAEGVDWGMGEGKGEGTRRSGV
jgi:hypothetical protein